MSADISQSFQHADQLHRQGQLDEAERLYRAILAMQPDHFDTLHQFGVLLFQQGRNAEALSSLRDALAVRKDDALALANLGFVQARSGHPEAALVSYDEALAIRPDYADALERRGNALMDLKRPTEALENYDKALALEPNHFDALNHRGVALLDLKRPKEALTAFDRALALQPESAAVLNNRGNALRDLGRTDEALALYERALGVRPDFVEALENKGILLVELGRLNEAVAVLETAVALAPRRVHTYYSLTDAKRLARGDPHLRAMEDLLRDVSSLSPGEQIHLHFALGKAFADIGDHARSFQHLLDGNALKRRQTIYDEAAILEIFEGLQQVFTKEVMGAAEGLGHPSALPVFVVGMPRSGTTLVEQILASHPLVFGAGETNDFAMAVEGLEADADEEPRSPDEASLLWSRRLQKLGKTYVERIQAAAPAAERITNKTLENFRNLGMIHLALPNARIIHVRRNPMDTCLSCFSKLFDEDLAYTYDLAELGRHYRAYEALMAHWREVLPAAALLEVQYEEVVADLEGQARRIVAHCGLDWDPRCLDFHLTERSVRTASATQVRQPIYKSSMGRWRAYEPFLEPLIAELGPSTASLGADSRRSGAGQS